MTEHRRKETKKATEHRQRGRIKRESVCVLFFDEIFFFHGRDTCHLRRRRASLEYSGVAICSIFNGWADAWSDGRAVGWDWCGSYWADEWRVALRSVILVVPRQFRVRVLFESIKGNSPRKEKKSNQC